jgi:hypothetical protein
LWDTHENSPLPPKNFHMRELYIETLAAYLKGAFLLPLSLQNLCPLSLEPTYCWFVFRDRGLTYHC